MNHDTAQGETASRPEEPLWQWAGYEVYQGPNDDKPPVRPVGPRLPKRRKAKPLPAPPESEART